MRPFLLIAVALAAGLAAFVSPIAAQAQAIAGGRPAIGISVPVTHNRYAYVAGVKIFYREAGPAGGPAVFLPHGFPSSSNMFRNLIPFLADRYRVIAPDYPGFGLSDAPDRTNFAYTSAHCATLMDGLLEQLHVARYAMYLFDYGAPVGYRVALKHPGRVNALIVQNGNAYAQGLQAF